MTVVFRPPGFSAAPPKPSYTPSMATTPSQAASRPADPTPPPNPLAGNFDSRANPWAIPGQAPQTGPVGNTDPNAGINYVPGQNGYAGQYQVGDVANPYQAGLQAGMGDISNLQGAIPGMQQQAGQNMWGAMQGMSNYQQSVTGPGNYPTYPNAAGAGTNSFGGGPGTTPISPMGGLGDSGGGSDPSSSDTAHGFNPWSLTGEAMSRR